MKQVHIALEILLPHRVEIYVVGRVPIISSFNKVEPLEHRSKVKFIHDDMDSLCVVFEDSTQISFSYALPFKIHRAFIEEGESVSEAVEKLVKK